MVLKMNSYVTGEIIKELREKKGYTQSKLAEILMVSEKTVSKWESKRGLPDITLLEPLAKALGISLVELFNGKTIINSNKSANMLKVKFYVCPICGNVVTSIGEGFYSCCGNELICEEAEEDNELNIKYIDNEIYVQKDVNMTKNDYISFIAYVNPNNVQLTKLYPEQACEATFIRNGKGMIYYYNNRNGLFKKKM